MSYQQKVGWTHDVKVQHVSFENVMQFKYLGGALTSQNSSQE